MAESKDFKVFPKILSLLFGGFGASLFCVSKREHFETKNVFHFNFESCFVLEIIRF